MGQERRKVVYTVLDKVGIGPVEAMRVTSAFMERHPILITRLYAPPYDEYHKLCEEVEVAIGETQRQVLVCGWVTWSHNITVEVK